MTSRADRSELSQALAKAIAYRDCGQDAKAAVWAAKLVAMLDAKVARVVLSDDGRRLAA